MFFYEIAPASRQYHGSTPLTYSFDQKLAEGRIVVVKIRSKTITGFVIRQVAKPDFKTNPIEETLPLHLSPEQLGLFKWLLEYYPAPLGVTAQLFLPLNSAKDYLPKPNEKNDENKAPAPTNKESGDLVQTPPPLNKEQSEAVKIIREAASSTVVLHGDTGSGKTRVYIELAQEALAAKKTVLILVPEIALSPQIVKTFTDYLNFPIRVTHSNLTPAKRRKVWQAISQETGPQVVIGPRSALFMPLNNIGLIVVDEFHESAYKQDQAPYYHSLRLASQFSNLHKARLILGSATPSVAEYYVAEQKNAPIIRMHQKAALADQQPEAEITTKLVNLKGDSEKTKFPLISQSLVASIKETLDRQEQTLLFLNKRGSARLILCQNCGWHALCPNCDLPLTFHGDTYKLQCHTCGYSLPSPSVCPECSSHDIIFKSPGTKAVVEAIQHLFPEARIARFDKDNRKSERLEERHGEILSGDIDILIGTQLLAKGHDLPRLGLVGILLAENELQFPDYTSAERSYQLMHQLIGRVGRGHRTSGQVVVQTYDLDNLAVRTAIREQSWDDFYQAQISERKLFGFPPFYYLMKIEVNRARLPSVTSACDQIIKFVKQSGEPVEITGPNPSFIEKRAGQYHWQIIIKAKQRKALTKLAQSIPVKCTINLDPTNLL